MRTNEPGIFSKTPFLAALLFVMSPSARVQAQANDQGKPPIYTYISEWSVPRGQWPDMLKVDEQDRPLMDKLVADGTLTG
ncbi:MAG: hypothetical protein JO061_19390, partial [Acidobacteriaceae bacterium]|nr:hypothetical protein [Acidobacteriaceae bacterium]